MDALTERYEQLLGERFTRETERLGCLRINTLHAPADIVQRMERKAKLEKVEFLNNAYWYSAEKSMGATPEYLLGYYYLQEAASQLPALVLNPNTHAVVLDMAASPGSKTTQLASIMENTGVIVAVEQKAARMTALAENIERCGVKNAVLYRKDARFVKDFHKQFTHILLDAPCSGNYVIEPDFFKKKSLATIKQMQELQRELLKAAAAVLAPGGTLVYSTCSLEPEEDEEQIDWLLGKHHDLEVASTGLSIGEPGYTEVFGRSLNGNVRKTRRLWPQKTGTQGFYIAKIVRKQ